MAENFSINIGERGVVFTTLAKSNQLLIDVATRSKLPKGSVVVEDFYGECRITILRPNRKPVTEWITI